MAKRLMIVLSSVVVLATFVALHSQSSDGQSVDLSTLIQRIKATESKTNSGKASLTFIRLVGKKFMKWLESDLKNTLGRVPVVGVDWTGSDVEVYKVRYAFKGSKYRCQLRRHYPPYLPQEGGGYDCSFDGVQGYRYEFAPETATIRDGRFFEGQEFGRYMGLFDFNSIPFSESIANSKPTIAGMETINGTLAYKLVSPSRTYWVAPSLGYRLIKYEFVYPKPPEDKTGTSEVLEFYSFRQYSEGVYLPKVGVSKTLVKSADGKKQRANKVDWFRIEDFRITPELPDSYFVIEFPPGILVKTPSGVQFEGGNVVDAITAVRKRLFPPEVNTDELNREEP